MNPLSGISGLTPTTRLEPTAAPAKAEAEVVAADPSESVDVSRSRRGVAELAVLEAPSDGKSLEELRSDFRKAVAWASFTNGDDRKTLEKVGEDVERLGKEKRWNENQKDYLHTALTVVHAKDRVLEMTSAGGTVDPERLKALGALADAAVALGKKAAEAGGATEPGFVIEPSGGPGETPVDPKVPVTIPMDEPKKSAEPAPPAETPPPGSETPPGGETPPAEPEDPLKRLAEIRRKEQEDILNDAKELLQFTNEWRQRILAMRRDFFAKYWDIRKSYVNETWRK